jgi:hypothetical protein
MAKETKITLTPEVEAALQQKIPMNIPGPIQINYERMIADAVAAEREACAQAAENTEPDDSQDHPYHCPEYNVQEAWWRGYEEARKDIVAAIRARGAK